MEPSSLHSYSVNFFHGKESSFLHPYPVILELHGMESSSLDSFLFRNIYFMEWSPIPFLFFRQNILDQGLKDKSLSKPDKNSLK